MLALAFQREIDHHDSVLFHDADQQHNADNRDHVEILVKENQCEESADARRWQRGQNGDRVDEALIQNAKHDVDGDQRGENEQWHSA